jgi:hypothetical protein
VPHADSDDYFWVPTDPPYREMRAIDERLALMEAMFAPREAWVLSGSLAGWGDGIVARCDGVVFLSLDTSERLDRLRERESVRAQGQVADAAARRHFLEWAGRYDDPTFTGRSRTRHEAWLAGLGLPVLRLDSARPVGELVEAVLRWEPEPAPG